MSDAASVHAVQQALLAAILERREPAPDGLRDLFRTPPLGSIDARWHVYAHGFLARIVEAIENDYPAVAKVLGDGPLRSLTARYLLRFPPRSRDIGRVGDRLAHFLESDPLTKDLPFLPDLACLEWAVAEAFVAADGDALRWQDLAELGAAAAADRPLRLRPETAVVRSAWPIQEIWACRDRPAEEIDVPLHGGAGAVLVARRGLEVVCRRLAQVEEAVVALAARGGRLADFLDQDGGTASEVVEAFRHLVGDGAFARTADGSPPAA